MDTLCVATCELQLVSVQLTVNPRAFQFVFLFVHYLRTTTIPYRITPHRITSHHITPLGGDFENILYRADYTIDATRTQDTTHVTLRTRPTTRLQLATESETEKRRSESR